MRCAGPATEAQIQAVFELLIIDVLGEHAPHVCLPLAGEAAEAAERLAEAGLCRRGPPFHRFRTYGLTDAGRASRRRQ